jgi:hypothetical protein
MIALQFFLRVMLLFHLLNIFFLLQYTIAMMGYDDEDKTTVIELTYNYGVTEYSKGNAYAQVLMKSFLCSVLLNKFSRVLTGVFF